MTGLTIGPAVMARGDAPQMALGVMTGIAAVMHGIVELVGKDASVGARGVRVTVRAFSGHGNRLTVINRAGHGMKGQPIAAMTGVTVSRGIRGQADQHPPPGRVMTEGAVTMMNCGRGYGISCVAPLAGIVAGGNDFAAMSAIGRGLKIMITGAMAGIAVIKGVGLWHGLARGDADQGDRSGGAGMTGRAAVVELGVCNAGGKYR